MYMTASQKVCGVCINWTGAREIDMRSTPAGMNIKESTGQCVLKGYGCPKQYYASNPCNCNGFQKYPGL